MLHKVKGERDDYDVMSGSMPVGRIYRRPSAGPDTPQWAWSITGVKDGPSAMVLGGAKHTLDEAKAELAKNWQEWLAWATLLEERKTPEI